MYDFATIGAWISGWAWRCQAATQPAISSSLPSEPAGLVSTASRSATAAMAAASGPGIEEMRARMSSNGSPVEAVMITLECAAPWPEPSPPLTGSVRTDATAEDSPRCRVGMTGAAS